MKTDQSDVAAGTPGKPVRCDVPDLEEWSADRLAGDPNAGVPNAGDPEADSHKFGAAEVFQAGVEVSGRAVCRYERPFNCPTGLQGQRVRLFVSGWSGTLTGVWLNDRLVRVVEDRPVTELATEQRGEERGGGAAGTAAEITGGHWELTEWLQPSNRVAIELVGTPGTASEPRLSGEVEIRIDG